MAAESTNLKMNVHHPQFDETTEEYIELLTTKSNLFKTYTADFLNLCLQLLGRKVLSGDEHDKICAGETHAEKVLRMVAIFKSKGFNAIPDISKSYRITANAAHVPDILDKFWNSNVLPRTSSPDADSGPNSSDDSFQATEKTNLDFEVTEVHKKGIADILCSNLTQNHWEEIKMTWLPLEIRNCISKQLGMRLDILACLEEWIIKAKSRDDKLFSKFVEVFKDYHKVKEILKEKQASLMKAEY